MRHAILIAVGIAISSLGCSQGRGDTSPAPPIPAVAPPELPAGAPLEKTYRVPVDGLPSIGDTRALVTIVAFTDYQCPYCRRAEATVTQLRQSALMFFVVSERAIVVDYQQQRNLMMGGSP